MSRLRRIQIAAAIAALVCFTVGLAPAADVKKSTYKGWKTLALKNDLVELQVAPELGGRIMQYRTGKNEFLWVNGDLAGQTPPPSGVGPENAWLNWGGDKLWPAPQGWSGPHEWPGPPGPVPNAEGLPYTARIVEAEGKEAAIELTGSKDQYAGVRFSRKTRVFDGSTRVSLESTMTNIDTKPRRWGIWSVTQVDCAGLGEGGFNPLMRAFCPINPKSAYPEGYKVLFGKKDNPAWQADAENKIMGVKYVRQVGKIAIDSTAGWLAVVNGKTGHCMVQRFKPFPEKKYPDGASVEFWINAGGTIKTDKEVEIPNDIKQTPPFLEAEILSPFAELKPGESYTFQTDWYACNVGGDHPVLECTDVGVVCEPLQCLAAWGESLHSVSGRFGVFYGGTARLGFLDASGKQIGTTPIEIAVTPDRPVITPFPHKDWRKKKIGIPEGAKQVSLFLTDRNGKYLGELGRASIQYTDWVVKQ